MPHYITFMSLKSYFIRKCLLLDMMKYFPSLFLHYLQNRASRRNLRVLVQFMATLVVMVTIYSVLFHYLMAWEGREYSWIAGAYWTLTVMSTLGFGDITFHTDLGLLFSIVVTYLLVQYLMRIARETKSIVIKADALHYKTDLLSNGAVLLALGLVYLTGLDIIDALFGLAIGMYIIYSAYEIIEEGVMMLLDRSLDREIVDKIEQILDEHSEVTGHHWLKTRTDGTINFIEFHMVLKPEMTLMEAHRIAEDVEADIMALDPDKRWVITPHFDPYDDEEMNEAMFHGVPVTQIEKKA